MYLNTNWTLSCDDDLIIIEDDKIKIYLKNGEILIGTYQHSDWTSLTIERDNCDCEIEFEEIENIEILDN